MGVGMPVVVVYIVPIASACQFFSDVNAVLDAWSRARAMVTLLGLIPHIIPCNILQWQNKQTHLVSKLNSIYINYWCKLLYLLWLSAYQDSSQDPTILWCALIYYRYNPHVCWRKSLLQCRRTKKVLPQVLHCWGTYVVCARFARGRTRGAYVELAALSWSCVAMQTSFFFWCT